MTERERLIELIKNARIKEVYKTNDGETVTSIDRRIIDWSEISILADYLLANGVIVPPCKVGDEINGEIVCEILYSETLGTERNNPRNRWVYTCDKADTEKRIYSTHPMTWEKAEQALRKECSGK